MTRTPHLTSDGAACCWIPLFPLRCETARQPELASLPVALVGPDDTRRVWQVAPREVRLLGGGHARATGRGGDRTGGRGGEVSRRPAARRAAARLRHASAPAPARRQDAGRARRATGGSGRIAVRPRRPAAVAARGGADRRAGGGAGRAGADRRRAHVLYGRRRAGASGARARPADRARGARSAA